MKESKIMLKDVSEGLIEILKPYQKQQNQRQKMVELLRQCVRLTEKDEFTFRFNRRTSNSRGKLFFRLIQQAVNIEPVKGRDILGG